MVLRSGWYERWRVRCAGLFFFFFVTLSPNWHEHRSQPRTKTKKEKPRAADAKRLNAVLVEVVEALGSTPREVGAWMIVGPDTLAGTIGGGELEYRAILRARSMLAEDAPDATLDLPLGPALNQCCGGFTRLAVRRLTPAVQAELNARITAERGTRPTVCLYGAGHVGRAVASALATLPCRVVWADARPGLLDDAPAGIEVRALDPISAAADAPKGAFHLVMTHSHPLDLDVCATVLKRGDFTWLGLIGSTTKRARFESRLTAAGVAPRLLARLVCPIGIDGIKGKEPAVIAASVAAQLLLAFEANAARQGKERA